MRYLVAYYHYCGRRSDCNRVEFMSLRVLRITTEIFIHRIISGDKQSFTVLIYQRTNNPGSALGIRRGQNIPRFGQQVKNTFFRVYLATASSRCSGKNACVADWSGLERTGAVTLTVSRKTALSCGSVGKIEKEGKIPAAGIRIRDEANRRQRLPWENGCETFRRQQTSGSCKPY